MGQKVALNPSLSDFKWDDLAQFMEDELSRRKKARRYLEGIWAEIARQKALKPSPPRLDISTGKTNELLGWMPYLETPWQIQTLEIGCADSMRLAIPPNGRFFKAKPDAQDKDYAAVIDAAARNEGMLVGEVNQEDIAAIVEAVLLANQRSYNLKRQLGLLIADGLSYGTGAGRGRPGTVATLNPNYTGIAYREGDTIPMFTNMSIWNTYLDDRYPAAMQQDYLLSPATIYSFSVNFSSIQLAAKEGSSDPENPDGGWIKDAFKDLEADNAGNVSLVELEGDIELQDNDGEWIVMENACATAITANNGAETVCRIVRFRQSDKDFRRCMHQPYFQDTMHPRRFASFEGDDLWGYRERGSGYAKNQYDSDFASSVGVYGVGPLMFGYPMQKAGSDAFSRSIQAGILNVMPPIKTDKNDPFYRGDGFIIAPGQVWNALETPEVVNIADQNALGGWYQQMKVEHANVTATDAPRLGQQTKSHQTAYAVDTELQRGTVRIVDYVQDLKTDLLPSWLHMEYAMLRRYLPRRGVRVWVEKYKGFMTVTRDMLPERCDFDVHGAAQPLEEQQQEARMIRKIELLAQVDQIAVQNGAQPMNWAEVRRAIIEEEEIDAAKLTPEVSGVDVGTESLSPQFAVGPEVPGPSGSVTALDDIRLASGAQGSAGQ